MTKKNLILGITIGAAALSAAYFMSKKGRFNLKSLTREADGLIDRMRGHMGNDDMDEVNLTSAHSGKHLAEKVRHRAEHKISKKNNL